MGKNIAPDQMKQLQAAYLPQKLHIAKVIQVPHAHKKYSSALIFTTFVT